MTARAFVLIETAVGTMNDVVGELTDLPGVERVETVTGPYDVIATLCMPTMANIGNMITDNIHLIKGINRTVTCLDMDER
ncbi:MAG: Lrp/AsnC family transcriptional regulator [SAR202 cluster bacterium]|jgi:DNA-binding Lrp family transcriptional regulator|nr:Lrp/AsnC family transcriptional regulator [SAR202 cluster bacterium]